MPISLQRCPPCLSNSDDLVSTTIDGMMIPTSASLSKNGFKKKKTIVLPNMFYIIPTWIV